MADSTAKKEKQKKKAKAKQDKAERMKERKANNSKGKSLEEMFAYIDENGNLSETPPDPAKMRTISVEDIQLDVSARTEEFVNTPRKGTITFFNEAKGYGFITDSKTRENIFVHMNQLLQPVKERDMVTFETERTPKGLSAVRVTKIK
jgi:cold shock CspA family protein